jgi:hypothetical protein
MSKIAIGIVIVVAAAGAAVVWLQRETNAALRTEIASLRTEVDRLAKSREVAAATPSKPTAVETTASLNAAADREELTRLRADVAALQKQSKDFARIAQQTQGGGATVPTRLIPVSEWKNAGRDTPAATAETLLWAAAGGDVNTIASAVELTNSAREKAEAWFAGLPEQTRSDYGSADKLVALMIAKDAATVSGMQVLGQREIAADTVGMRVRFGNDEGKTKDDSFALHHSTDGWKLLIPDPLIEKWTRQLAGK